MPPMSLSTPQPRWCTWFNGNPVPLGQTLAVPPAPAGGNARVVEVGDLVVGDRVVRAVADPHADGAWKDPSAVANDVVVDGDVAGPLGFVRPAMPDLANPHAAGAEVVQVAAPQRAVAASLAEPHARKCRHGRTRNPRSSRCRAVGHDHRLDGRGRLGCLESSGRRDPLGVPEGRVPHRSRARRIPRPPASP